MHLLLNSILLFAFWYCLSGKTEPFYLILGALSSIAVAWLCRNSFYVLTKSLFKLPIIFLRGLFYFFWLMKSILLAALHVTAIVLNPKLPLKPKLYEHETLLTTDHEKLTFANSITLTPGTITVDVSGNKFLIHQIDEASSGDILNRNMEKRIQQFLKGASHE